MDSAEIHRLVEKYAWLVLIAVMAIYLSYWFVCYCGDSFREIDVYVFYQYAQNIDAGLVPYRDFSIEFPPVAVLFYYIPYLFSSVQDGYVLAFAALVTVFVFLTFLFGLLLMKRLSIGLEMQMVYVIAFLYFIHRYYLNLAGKFDIFVVFFALLAVLLFIEGRRTWAYAVVAFAALIKFYPGLIMLLFLVYDCTRIRADGREPVIRGIAAAVAVGVISILPFLAMGASFYDMFGWLAFHSDRGFQVESTVAVLVQFFGDHGIGSYTLVERYHTYDVSSPLTDALSLYWTPVVFVMLALFLLSIAMFIRRNGFGDGIYDKAYLAVLGTLGAILLFVYTNKVFSTQYLMWFLPWMLVLGAFRTIQEEVFLSVAFMASVYVARFTGSTLFSTYFFIRALILAMVIAYILKLVLRDGYPERRESFLAAVVRLIASRQPRSRRRT